MARTKRADALDIPTFLLRKGSEYKSVVVKSAVQTYDHLPTVTIPKSMQTIRVNEYEKQHVGVEPTETINSTDWYYIYNYHFFRDDAIKFLTTYLEHLKLDRYLDAVNRVNKYAIPLGLGWIARMKSRGISLPDTVEQYFVRSLETLIKLPSVATIEKAPIKDRSREVLGDLIATVDGRLDNFHDEKDTNWYEFFTKNQVKPAHAKALVTKFVPLERELDELTGRKPDPMLVENYSNLTKKDRVAFKLVMDSLMADATRYASNQKIVRVRRPRAKKVKDAAKVVSRAVYRKEDKDLKLVSVDPVSVIGSSSAWLFNCKNHVLTMLIAPEGKTLNVRGTSIVDHDEKTSMAKRVRKPAEVIKELMDSGRVAVRKVLPAVKTKEYRATGRLNADTLILRVGKT